MRGYGKELIIDLHNLSHSVYLTQSDLQEYFDVLCETIDMEQVRTEWWEEYGQDEPHLNGISAVQFIKTSNITIHYAPDLKQIHINIFSCKDFDSEQARWLTHNWFGGTIANCVTLERP